MIFVFGSILQLIRVETDAQQKYEQFEFTRHYRYSVAGKGGLQALAAAKAGAKAAIVSKTGDDELAKHILLRLRKHGVVTSGVAKTEELQTGTAIRLEHENRTIIALGASAKASAEQIPAEVLTDQHIILLQTELDPAENSQILKTAKEKGARTILNISPRFEVTAEDISHLDYVIMSVKHKAQWNALAAQADGGERVTAIFISPDGAIELQIKGTSAPLPKAKLEALNWAHPEGYEDAFCGTFAAGLDARLPLDKVILKAHVAAALTASQPGGYNAIPYSDSVDECLKALEES
ncbi:MAG: PfkB family carbohydrate kinase [Alphaproteobacteria bacterium]